MLAILGKSLPNVVGYFATFIMTKILAGLPLILLRFGPLIWLVFIKLCLREKYMTQAEIDEAYYPQMFSQVNYNNYGNCHALLFSFLTVFSSRSCDLVGSIQIYYWSSLFVLCTPALLT